jgi:hypothetical protein
MMRISASRSHESVRIKKSALAHGLNFAKVGTLMLKGYLAHPEVLAAQIYYITLPDFHTIFSRAIFIRQKRLPEHLIISSKI